METTVAQLRNEQDSLEQYSRRNSLRISGITESEHEDPGQICLDLFNDTLELGEEDAVSPADIDRVHGVGKKMDGKTRSILVKFATYRVHRRVFSN